MPDFSYRNVVVVRSAQAGQDRAATMLAELAGDFHVKDAMTYADAETWLGEGKVDAVIVLGGQDRAAIIKRIRSIVSHTQAPAIIVLTGQASADDESAALQAGADLVVPASSMDAPLLRSLLLSAIHHKQHARQSAEDRRVNDSILSESEERFHQMADSMPQLVWTARPDGVVDYYNQRYREFFGIQPVETGEDVWQWAPTLHVDDVDATVEAWNTAVQEGTMYEIEHRVTRADGSFRWYLSRGLPYRNEQGEIIKWFGTATDIHEQKMAEQALRESETRFRRLVDSNIIGVFFAHASGLIIEANQAFLDMIGCTLEDMQAGKLRWNEIVVPAAREQEKDYLHQALREGASGLHELNYVYNDGQPIPVLVGYAALEKQGMDFVCFTLDLSQQKEAERVLEQYAARLEESNRQLEQFAYAASHDLQEPLRKIQSFGEILNQRVAHKLTEEETDYFARIRASTKRLQVMIDSLLSLGRITSQAHAFTQINTNALVREVLADLEISIYNHHADVQLAPLPDLYGDPAQIHQLLQNLISNAVKFHAPGQPPRVSISGRDLDETMAEIRVQDNGIGFSSTHLGRIFEPFERLQARSDYEGVGMGLAICRTIVERHGGSITADSQPGNGATFIITLPTNPKPVLLD